MLGSLRSRRKVQGSDSKHTSASSAEERRTKDGYVHQSMGCVDRQDVPGLRWSAAGYQARNPFGDVSLVQAEGHTLLAAMLSCKPSAQGGRYLQRMLGREVGAQLRGRCGDAPAALAGALAALDQAFRNLHPFNGPVLEGVRVAIALVDLKERAVHMASNGGCMAVVGRSTADGEVEVAGEVGRSPLPSEGADLNQAHLAPDALRFASVPLQRGADTVIVGSEGLWRELAGQKALLRLQHYLADAPEACGRNAALHLTNFALHTVAARTRRQADPRMRSLSSVERLQSLWTGDKSGYRWGKRQPVRRRRGDVHGDLSAIVIHLDAQGGQPPAPAPAARKHSSLAASLLPSAVSGGSGARQAAASEAARRWWSLVRLHLVTFPRASRALTRARWAEVSAAVVEAQRAERAHRRRAAEALLRWNPPSSSGAASRTGSLGAADQAARLGSLSAAALAQHWGGPRRPASVFAPLAGGPPSAGQALSDEDEVSDVPSGQPLVPTHSYGTTPSGASSASSSLSWQRTPSWQQALHLHHQQQQQQGGLSRTISRRQLFAPPPTVPAHAQLQEEGDEEELADRVARVGLGGSGGEEAPQQAPARQEWQAYEQHKRLLPAPSPALLHKLADN